VRFGEENAAKLAKWHNEPAETYLAYSNGEFMKLPRGTKVEDVEGFAEGAFIVQDPATHHAVELLDPKKGERILDACAAPGGKTIQIAWRGADVTACEVNPKRRRRLEENLKRTGVSAKVINELADGLYDKVLVDAPCSNTGVLRRRPDARWNWSEEKMRELVKLQSQILDVCARLVAPGGTLVYSTCSNEPEENALQVEAFLARHGDFEFIEARESVPFDSLFDGAFAASMKKSK
jgi:16S rRNA (cytosine967-C5)-methyltransferase